MVALQKEKIESSEFKFEKITLDNLHSKLNRCTNTSEQKKKLSPSAAFEELIKLIFVKVEKNKELREKPGPDVEPILRILFSNPIGLPTKQKVKVR